ncbi:MAG: universal stress protein [Desulfobacterales bacterium]|jgi:nucleotide-binding universal stress UspA family protein
MKRNPSPKQERILLPIDGSERCLETVRYVARYEPFHAMKVVLFNVFSDVPDCYWDLEREPKSVKTVRHVRAWVGQKKKEMETYMETAREILLRGGGEGRAVSIRIHSRKKGVARDILAEAHKGYTAVVVRRRGATGLRNIVMGSVAVKLMEKMSFVPLIIVGRKAMTQRVLIGVDGSDGANRAVDFTAGILHGHGFSAHLINVMRSSRSAVPPGEKQAGEPVCPEEAEEEMLSVLGDARKRMAAAGFSPEKVTTKVITGAASRAAAIAEEADAEGCETIVVGRRGLSGVKSFFIGRVSNKVVHMARKNTVWVVT